MIGVAMFAATSSVNAALVTGIFSGTVASGNDTSGYFVGAANAGQALDGASVAGTFSYDDAALDGSGLGFSVRIFGAGYDATYSFGGFSASASTLAVDGFDGPDSLSLLLERFDDTSFDSEALSLFLDGDEFLTGNGIPSVFSFLNPVAFSNGSLTVMRPSDGIDFSAFLSVTVASAGVPGGGIVPEPASWALMIAGFGLAGSALRLRSRQALRTNH